MKVFGMCFNMKVVAGLAVVGLGVWWLAPGAVAAALPLLLLAICPLSMLFMMKAMNNMNGQQQGQHTPQTSAPQPADVPAGQATLPIAAHGVRPGNTTGEAAVVEAGSAEPAPVEAVVEPSAEPREAAPLASSPAPAQPAAPEHPSRQAR